jgi:hypothetical protein
MQRAPARGERGAQVIRALRARHRALATILALALPLGISLALSSRRDAPRLERLPSGDPADPGPRTQVKQRTLRVGNFNLDTRTWPDDRLAAFVLEVAPREDLQRPDVLVYWSQSAPQQDPDASSVLLGALAGTSPRRFALPPQAIDGYLSLYSLAHRELLGSAEFER